MQQEKVFLIGCIHCKNMQRTIVRSEKIIGKSRKCFFCGRNIQINNETIVKRIK